MRDESADDRGLEEFCRAQHRPLVRLLRLTCGDAATAEDLAQEALARAWLHWDLVRTLDAPELWVRRVALNLSASWWRRRRTATREHPRLYERNSGDRADESPAVDLLGALAALPLRQRTAVVLRFFEDRSVAETARIMRCKEGTVKSLTSQGLEVLRRAGIRNDEDA